MIGYKILLYLISISTNLSSMIVFLISIYFLKKMESFSNKIVLVIFRKTKAPLKKDKTPREKQILICTSVII